MIPANSNDFLVDTESTNSGKKSAATMQTKRRRVLQLVEDCKTLLKDAYNQQEFQQIFLTVKTAKSRGLLGTGKPADICAADSVNIANDILRSRKFDEPELDTETNQPRALYVYVSLVAIGLIPA